MKKFFSKIIKLVIFVAAVVLQAAVIVLPLLFIKKYSLLLNTVFSLISMVMAFYLVRTDMNPSYKIPWLFILLVFPFFGWIMYIMYGKVYFTHKERIRFNNLGRRYREASLEVPFVNGELREKYPDIYPQAEYLYGYANAPVYGNTECEYFPCGEAMFEAMLEELEKAEKFIFMEYFIIDEGYMFSRIMDILIRKSRQGVDVRLVYDSLGSLVKSKEKSVYIMKKNGIECHEFNRLVSIMGNRYNNRDHRKLCIIDGNVGFTGGINIADEYINRTHPFGVWKDTAVMLKGNGVWAFTVMFITLLNSINKTDESLSAYRPDIKLTDTQGYYVPFTDYPIDNEANGRNVYLNMINRARKYVYIMTPYLILDNLLLVALENAAKSGIDVRIITPGRGDKKLIYMLTRSYYEPLINAGVKIYEYSPGFVHAKVMLSDDAVAVVGTINLDYRSLTHHYENAVWMCESPVIKDIYDDFIATLQDCRIITPEFCRKKTPAGVILIPVLRLFSPML